VYRGAPALKSSKNSLSRGISQAGCCYPKQKDATSTIPCFVRKDFAPWLVFCRRVPHCRGCVDGHVLSAQERPYHSDSTASRPLCEVKHCRARLVLRWGTTLESRVLFFCRITVRGALYRHCHPCDNLKDRKAYPNHGSTKSSNSDPNVHRWPAGSGAQAHHRSNTSSNQTHHSRKPKTQASACKPHHVCYIHQWNLPL
jgi:hypothetical protein